MELTMPFPLSAGYVLYLTPSCEQHVLTLLQVGFIGLVDEWYDMDQIWTRETHGGWTYRRLYLL
jgi:hypothetical protein